MRASELLVFFKIMVLPEAAILREVVDKVFLLCQANLANIRFE